MNAEGYIAFPESWLAPGYVDPKRAIAAALKETWWPTGVAAKVYEVGPEVKEPDYGPLVAWLRREMDVLHKASCAVATHPGNCDFKRALKAAQIG